MQPDRPRQKSCVAEVSDSTRWDAFEPRPGDIVVTTPPKSGTTWTQSILAMLIAGDPAVNAETAYKSPWIDISIRSVEEVMERLAAQDHRRQVKTHTPFDGIPYWSGLRYISVYRHPIDVHFSFRKHNENMAMDALSDFFPEDIGEGFEMFLEGGYGDAASLSLIVQHYRCALELEPAENLIRLHYADMLRDLPGTVEAIAAHVGISHPPELIAQIVDAATFDSMKRNAHLYTPSAGKGFWQNDAGFFDSASSNKWVGKLSDAHLEAYDARMSELLTPEERAWLEWGSVPP